MKHYGLLPNDAIIAVTCKCYNIDTLMAFDADFKHILWLKIVPWDVKTLFELLIEKTPSGVQEQGGSPG